MLCSHSTGNLHFCHCSVKWYGIFHNIQPWHWQAVLVWRSVWPGSQVLFPELEASWTYQWWVHWTLPRKRKNTDVNPTLSTHYSLPDPVFKSCCCSSVCQFQFSLITSLTTHCVSNYWYIQQLFFKQELSVVKVQDYLSTLDHFKWDINGIYSPLYINIYSCLVVSYNLIVTVANNKNICKDELPNHHALFQGGHTSFLQPTADHKSRIAFIQYYNWICLFLPNKLKRSNNESQSVHRNLAITIIHGQKPCGWRGQMCYISAWRWITSTKAATSCRTRFHSTWSSVLKRRVYSSISSDNSCRDTNKWWDDTDVKCLFLLFNKRKKSHHVIILYLSLKQISMKFDHHLWLISVSAEPSYTNDL